MTKICLHLALSRPPFLFGNVKKLAIHVSIFCRGGHNSCAVGWLAVYQVQRVLTIICCCCCSTTEICFCAMNVCLWPTPPLLLLHNCAFQIVQRLHIAQLCGRRLCASVCDNCFITRRLRPAGYVLCISVCSFRCKCLHMFRFLHNGSRPRENLVFRAGGIFL